MLRALITLPLLLCGALALTAQVYTMDGDNIADCVGTFYDSEQLGTYNPLDSLELVICPGLGGESHSRLNFASVDIAEGDSLRFFDGIGPMAPEIFPLTDIYQGTPFNIQASAANNTGCLTVRFVTDDDANVGEGWVAGISCVPACQPIVSEVQYDTEPVDGNIEFCTGEEINLNASVNFPDNGLVYNQSVDSTDFYWVFGSDTVATGLNTTWLPPAGGFGNLQLISTDQRGCNNLDVNRLWAFIGPSPSVQMTGPDELIVCPGDTIVLFTSGANKGLPGFQINDQPIITQEPTDSSFFQYIDGPNHIISTITLENYPIDATLSETIGLDSIRFLLEHSYSGDLEMDIECPTGQSVKLLDYPSGTGSTNFGEPFATGPVDGQSADLTPGIPYAYSFSDQAEYSLIDFDDIAPVYNYTTVPSTQNGNTHTYLDTYFPSGSYLPEESLDGLLGCPLNGEWKFTILDNLGLDNGWFFGWSLHFSGVIPADDSISNAMWTWEADDMILSQNRDSVVIVPTEAGLQEYVLNVDNLFGCAIQAVYPITVLPENGNFCQGFAPTIPDTQVDPFPWPNPFGGELNISLVAESEGHFWRIFSSNGQLMREGYLNNSPINTSSWPAGIYVLQVIDPKGELVDVSRVIKQ